MFGPLFGIHDFGAFGVAILLFLALPGPGTFALLTSTAKGGFRAGDGIELGQAASLWRTTRSRAPTIGMWMYRPSQDRPTAASIASA